MAIVGPFEAGPVPPGDPGAAALGPVGEAAGADGPRPSGDARYGPGETAVAGPAGVAR
jgi:hypothetical protein